MKLGIVPCGSIIDGEWIVMNHFADGSTEVWSKNLVMDNVRFGTNNNWKESNVRDRLYNDILPKVQERYGKDNIVSHEVDLFSMDGLDDYGKCLEKISIPSIDTYRKYRKILPQNMPRWWWLLTPDSTPSGYGADYVQCVGSYGNVDYDCYFCDGGVRCVLYLESSISVSVTEEPVIKNIE